LVVTADDELAARRDALKIIVERQIELHFRLSERDGDNNASGSSDDADHIKRELDELSDLKARHRVCIESAIKHMQTTIDEFNQDLIEMSTVCMSLSTYFNSIRNKQEYNCT